MPFKKIQKAVNELLKKVSAGRRRSDGECSSNEEEEMRECPSSEELGEQPLPLLVCPPIEIVSHDLSQEQRIVTTRVRKRLSGPIPKNLPRMGTSCNHCYSCQCLCTRSCLQCEKCPCTVLMKRPLVHRRRLVFN